MLAWHMLWPWVGVTTLEFHQDLLFAIRVYLFVVRRCLCRHQTMCRIKFAKCLQVLPPDKLDEAMLC